MLSPSKIPMFEMYNMDWLAARLPYKLTYLVCVKAGWKEVTPRFRRTCASVLAVPEAKLFGPDPVEVAS